VDIERYSRCCGAGSLERGSCLSSEHEPRKGFVYAKQTSQGECFARRKPRKRDCARMWGVERRRAARKFSEETVRFAASQEVVDRRARSADLESGLRLRCESRRDCGISDLESGSSFSQSSMGIAWCSVSLDGCSISLAQVSKGIGESGVKSPKKFAMSRGSRKRSACAVRIPKRVRGVRAGLERGWFEATRARGFATVHEPRKRSVHQREDKDAQCRMGFKGSPMSPQMVRKSCLFAARASKGVRVRARVSMSFGSYRSRKRSVRSGTQQDGFVRRRSPKGDERSRYEPRKWLASGSKAETSTTERFERMSRKR
jgi:hypothetical protein